ncbi:quinone-dependent dihydroorotate dehydrogenase [bacterium]|nr:quinone-dependent dihydroorotate dehydrogenase [bacterium]
MSLFDSFYIHVARPLLFQVDPETVHDWMMRCIPYSRPLKPWIKSFFSFQDAQLEQEIWGLKFANPIGLAGGFDKNAECADMWDMFGFGFVELGTVTPLPQAGNPKPRLFRYPREKALVNRMGFNNDGSARIAKRLSDQVKKKRGFPGITGISIGKQFNTPVDNLELVKEDYVTCLETLYPYADYFAVNVSSPNTQNLRDLQSVDHLDILLGALLDSMDEHVEGQRKPLLVKFAPDLSDDDIKSATHVILNRELDGIIATNTTNQTGGRETGGLSGTPLRERATDVIRLIAAETGGTLPLIGSGGIFTVEDAIEKMKAGAWLLQGYTGFVYHGPAFAKTLCEGICQYMKEQNCMTIQDLHA